MNGIVQEVIQVVNGFLVILFYAVDHLLLIMLACSSIGFSIHAPREQRLWAASSAGLAVLASLLSPFPVPFFLLLISAAGWAGHWLERYNRSAQDWNVVRGQAMYSLAGLGFAVYRASGIPEVPTGDPMLSQGAVYLSGLIGIAMYVIPLGWLVMFVQSIWAHPPSQGGPESLITSIRTRGKP